MSLVEQELLTIQEYLSPSLVFSVVRFMCMFCRSLYVLFLLTIVLSVFQFTDSDYPFGVFKVFLCLLYCWIYLITLQCGHCPVGYIISDRMFAICSLCCVYMYPVWSSSAFAVVWDIFKTCPKPWPRFPSLHVMVFFCLVSSIKMQWLFVLLILVELMTITLFHNCLWCKF